MRPSRLALTLVLALSSLPLGAVAASGTAGEPVRTFGESGRLRDTRPDCGYERFIDLLPSPDGGATVLVYCSPYEDDRKFHLARYLADGSRDTTFGGDGRAEFGTGLTDSIPAAHVRYADGSYAVLGSSTVGALSATKLTAAGALVEDYGTDGTSRIELGGDQTSVLAAEPRADGGIVAVVMGGSPYGTPRLLHLDPDGGLDADFDGDGMRPLTPETQGVVHDVVIRDGAVLTAGPSDHDLTHLSIRRYDATGAPDTGFGGDGHVVAEAWQTVGSTTRVAWAADGSVYVGFSADFVADGQPVAALSVLRFGADGTRDRGYGELGAARRSGEDEFDRVSDLIVDDAGRVVLSVDRWQFGGMRAARFTPTGEIDHSFGDAGEREVSFAPHLANADAVVQLANGDLLLAGDVIIRSGCCLAGTEIGLARLYSSMPHPERFVAIDPVRVLDTRATGGAVAAGTTRTVPVLGVRTVPVTGVNAVVVNVTVVGATSGGYLTVSEAGRPRPATSNVNFAKGDTVANAVTVKVGDAGALAVYAGGGSAHVLVDVAGYYTDGTAPAAGAGFVPVQPARILDTRPGRLAGDGAETAAGPHGTLRLKVAGRGGIPATGASAVVMTVTAVTPTASGFVTVWPAGPRPAVSSLNFAAGRTTSNLVTVKVDPEGYVTLFNSNGTTHLLADVAGYYDPASAATARVVTARRGYDSRPYPAFGPGETRGISPDLWGIPAKPGRAVVLNLTVTAATSGTFLTVYPHGQPRPATSNLNVRPGQTVAVQVIVPASAGGHILIYNALGSAHVVVDYQGWFQEAPEPA